MLKRSLVSLAVVVHGAYLKMKFGRKQVAPAAVADPVIVETASAEPTYDPTAFLIDSGMAELLLLSTPYIRYMAMCGYTYLHGCKLFPYFTNSDSLSYRFVSLILQCTGGGILVPIFINYIPVSLSIDAYPIAILASFYLHQYCPILRDVMKLSPILQFACIFLYETLRASVVVKFTAAAAAAIAPSDFAIPVFGPIFCGTVGGCGGAFLPMNKGLEPIRAGLQQPMLSAFVAATFYHFFVNTGLSAGVVEPAKKAQVVVAIFFIAYNIYNAEWNLPKVSVTKQKMQ